ncbi:related to tRNA-specific adenosine deaminase 1 [Melanopsichium pennsylvanicum]|uniref:Related to tRNA-specific adenosine deaminase 1 n=2 Tax=Melanopsichium pennsylvanicum TaxID=63383 RepID=A0AAJ5C4H9_9BASI|nr:related to tRNA-specific adenosine deaminase 1 [Melanopsichium pennsylvanicum 4]SNX83657.1 related to tRNA-specific adenosine deaminase 1 [Melanopsichium pennsylvanicum]
MAISGTNFEVDHDQIAIVALDTYLRTVPPRGAKPGVKSNGRKEWTILAALVLSYPISDRSQARKYTLISLGTGLKCLSYTSLPQNGDVLYDQHAEVLARRGARQWLLKRLEQEVIMADREGELRLFEQIESNEKRWKLKDEVKVHLYVSTLPCGDASNKLLEFQRAAQDEVAARLDVPTPAELLRLHLQASSGTALQALTKMGQPANGVVRGRASSTNLESTSSAGSLRTKPGRPDAPPSISMSCSDKIALWNAPRIGIQGSLLSGLLEPVYIHSVTMCDHPIRHIFPSFPKHPTEAQTTEQQREELKRILAEDCKRALQRARKAADGEILVGWSTTPFADGRESKAEHAWSAFNLDPSNDGKVLGEKVEEFRVGYEPVTCPNSILFIVDATLEGKGKAENLAMGTKMGAPTKRLKPKDPTSTQSESLKPQARSSVCKLNWFQNFVSSYNAITRSSISELRYNDAKQGQLGEGTRAYRQRKEELLGTRMDAQKVVDKFLSGARGGTAIQGIKQEQAQVSVVGAEAEAIEQRADRDEEARAFKGWLRTPASLIDFDLHGRSTWSHAALPF